MNKITGPPDSKINNKNTFNNNEGVYFPTDSDGRFITHPFLNLPTSASNNSSHRQTQEQEPVRKELVNTEVNPPLHPSWLDANIYKLNHSSNMANNKHNDFPGTKLDLKSKSKRSLSTQLKNFWHRLTAGISNAIKSISEALGFR